MHVAAASPSNLVNAGPDLCTFHWWYFASTSWRKYSTCTRATCTVCWWLQVAVVICICMVQVAYIHVLPLPHTYRGPSSPLYSHALYIYHVHCHMQSPSPHKNTTTASYNVIKTGTSKMECENEVQLIEVKEVNRLTQQHRHMHVTYFYK